jgi:hypothetical protein
MCFRTDWSDPQFLDWLFAKASEVTAPLPAEPQPPQPAPVNRLLNSAISQSHSEPTKRKLDAPLQGSNKKRLSDLPFAPRPIGQEGRSLAGRIGPRGGGIQVRGTAGIGRRGGPPGRMDPGPGMGLGLGTGEPA